MNNKLIIAAAGSGKTTFLINEAFLNSSENVLITTYTEANEAEIRKKIIEKKKCIPSNITIQTWFSFLIQHGAKPYQGAIKDSLFDEDIKGLLLTGSQSGIKKSFQKKGKLIKIGYKEDEEFEKHYFTYNWKIYSDKLSKFVYKCNKAAKGEVIKRLSKIYSQIYIDEVQDLAGYDLELIKLLFKSNSTVLLVGDPRQVTYLTHHEKKHHQYKDGQIKKFIQEQCVNPIKVDIDENSLRLSHRNNSEICKYSSKLYPDLYEIQPCNCTNCRSGEIEHKGIFLLKKGDVNSYLKRFEPVQLRWNIKVETHKDFKTLNFGEAKGLTFNRVVIYPTVDMEKWIFDNSAHLSNEARAKFYVAITRAKHSVAILCDFDEEPNISGVKIYKCN